MILLAVKFSNDVLFLPAMSITTSLANNLGGKDFTKVTNTVVINFEAAEGYEKITSGALDW